MRPLPLLLALVLVASVPLGARHGAGHAGAATRHGAGGRWRGPAGAPLASPWPTRPVPPSRTLNADSARASSRATPPATSTGRRRSGAASSARGACSRRTPPPEGGVPVQLRLHLPGPDTTFDARFPHSTHTEWLACATCHPRIFPYRNTPVTMGDVFTGRFCGECHGKVSFPVASGCERCHTRLMMPQPRHPDFLGTVQLSRVGDTPRGTPRP